MVKEIINSKQFNEGTRYYFSRLMKEKRIIDEISNIIINYIFQYNDVILFINLINNEKSKRFFSKDLM